MIYEKITIYSAVNPFVTMEYYTATIKKSIKISDN